MKTPALTHLIVAALVFLVLVGAYVYAFFETQRLERDVLTLSADIAAKTNEHQEAGSVRTALAEVEAQEAKLESHLVPASDIVPFLESVEALGSEFGARVSVLSVSDPAEDGKIALSLSVEGSFDAVMRTVGVLENSTRASVIRSLTLDAADDGMWSAAVSAFSLAPLSP